MRAAAYGSARQRPLGKLRTPTAAKNFSLNGSSEKTHENDSDSAFTAVPAHDISVRSVQQHQSWSPASRSLGAAVARSPFEWSVGERGRRRGVADPLVGLSIVTRLCVNTPYATSSVPTPYQGPLDASVVALQAGDVLADTLVEERLPVSATA